QLGIPIAIAKVIAELEAKGHSTKIPSVMKSSTFLTIITGAVFIPTSILFVPFLSGTLLGNPASSTALYAGIAIVPIAAIGGLIRGYFQGIARIEETAWSQLIEQFVRIILITWLLPSLLVSENTAMNAAYAMCITLLAELFSFVYLVFKYQQRKKRVSKDQQKTK